MNSPFTLVALAAVAVIAGALVPLQAGSNAELGRALGHPLWATLVSLVVSIFVVIPIVLAMQAQAPALVAIRQLPAWAWLGGVAGVIYISSALILVPRVGATSFIVCVIAGQLITSLLLDYHGWMNLPEREISIGRMVGVIFVLVGMVTVQWFSPTVLPAHPSTKQVATETYGSAESKG
ncbi:DMT family transporter [Nitrincola alkalisediminis]|uniref:DMT family transporter n=1 Tax=Nitrincola alkalisediminis TaxID=1366656 RepID=UPI00187460C1|nr:DMT family transporter [Nitrincola alkalisediminis]